MKTLLFIVALGLLCGCANDGYKKTGWYAPDGFNYTLSRDRQTGDLTDYWSLK